MIHGWLTSLAFIAVFMLALFAAMAPVFWGLVRLAGPLSVAIQRVRGVLDRRVRRAHVKAYRFPPELLAQFRNAYPQLDDAQCHRVAHALRLFFLARLRDETGDMVSPSKAVDDLWQMFIGLPQAYDDFCTESFVLGYFVRHRVPADPAGERKKGFLRRARGRAWWQSCLEEGLNPKRAARLPLLFALDEALNIPGGYRYVPGEQEPVGRIPA